MKPGPTPMTTGAMSRLVPRLRLARMASTRAAGYSSGNNAQVGSATTAISPVPAMSRASRAESVRRARTSSTSTSPRRSASEKHTVRRMEVGWGRSVMMI